MAHPPDVSAGDRSALATRSSNRLAAETSAYLRQHMHNPVDWHAWGAEAFAKAQAEDKPLLVSIGYSACHWCHVMERESFEDPDTAALMNRLFVNVKVDREERPDVDQIYMDTVVRLTGHGGWPLTVFCTPDGRPFFAGTYYPPREMHGRPSFRQVMESVSGAYRSHRDEVEKNAQLILQSLAKRPAGVASEVPGTASLLAAARELLAGADAENGGFGGAPKFPTPTNLDLLLAAGDAASGDEAAAAVAFVTFTAREMSRRGLYDQLGGGFHRYCVDATWTMPHFEKMLYDQGQLLRTYADAFRRRGDPELVWPMRETALYLRREMTGPEGGFYASQDADSEGVEGKFFVWTPAQIEAVLGCERAAGFCAAYGVTTEGNFEHGTTQLVDVARGPREEWEAERAALLAERAKRIPPATDRKRVAAWNALAISGLARAGGVLGDADLVSDAVRAADFVLTRMRDERGRLLRVWAPSPPESGLGTGPGKAHVPAFLDDVAGMLEACLDLHRAGAGERFLAEALAFADDLASRFFDETENDFFLTPEDGERLPHRPRSDHDGATPHSTGLAVLGLVRAASLAGRADLRALAERVIRTHAYVIERVPAAYPTLLRAAHLLEREPATAVIVGAAGDAATQALAAAARRGLAPEDAVVVSEPGAVASPPLDPTWLAGRGPVAGRPAAYLCRGSTCSLPVTDAEGLAALLPPNRRLS